MAEEVVLTPCGQECTSYKIEGGHACRRCEDQAFQDEMSAEADFFRDTQQGDPQ